MKESAYQPLKLSVPKKHANTNSLPVESAETITKEENVQHLGSSVRDVTSLDILHQSAGPNPFMPMKQKLMMMCQIIMRLVESFLLVPFQMETTKMKSTQLCK